MNNNLTVKRSNHGYMVDLGLYRAHRFGYNRPGVMTLISGSDKTNYTKRGDFWVANNSLGPKLVKPGSLEHRAFEALANRKKK